MASKSGKVSRTLQVLMEIRDDIREMRVSIGGLAPRIDSFLFGRHRDDHVALRGRVERIEAHLGLSPA